jgi:hypothetical protein
MTDDMNAEEFNAGFWRLATNLLEGRADILVHLENWTGKVPWHARASCLYSGLARNSQVTTCNMFIFNIIKIVKFWDSALFPRLKLLLFRFFP